MPDAFDPQRFLAAQQPVMESVRRELRSGRKRTHWMWFVFPQLQGLGTSAMARRFALDSIEEARAYLAHDVLGPRLVECCGLLLAVQGRSIHDILGWPDDMKFRSCLTLFQAAAPAEPVFGKCLDKYYGGRPDDRTLDLLRG
ncbi:MAG TPA: DUF1810 domain-containing protein [Ramlibacter sp.]|uniref:DUF1810 domain-containing protein n=1 Tax=Ramlibacter sp. TaxID=1917967 RepID=UPI002D099956|nr:DUF1810 domain-containing protein [Ramlibacter sp.]HVZ43429.1 DUF1810 domain-containing protein [Ramlibacter sp.]